MAAPGELDWRGSLVAWVAWVVLKTNHPSVLSACRKAHNDGLAEQRKRIRLPF
jgi:hypothetical protein